MAITAIDSDLQIPSWVPKIGGKVLLKLEFSAGLMNLDLKTAFAIDTIQRIADDPRMIEIWDELERFDIDPERFVNAIISAADWPPYESDLMAPKKHFTWEKKVKKVARELAELVHGSRYNDILMAKTLKSWKSQHISGKKTRLVNLSEEELNQTQNAEDLTISPLPYPGPHGSFTSLEKLLLEVVNLNEIDVMPHKKKMQLGKPKHEPHASHNHFTHNLIVFFEHECGEKLLAAVEAMAQVFFNNESINNDRVGKFKPTGD